MLRPVLTLVFVANAAAPALAQDGWGWSIIVPSVTGTDQLGLHLRDVMKAQQAPAAGSTAPASAALRYAPSATRRADNLKAFVARAQKVDPAGAEQLRTLFAAGDIIDRFAVALKPKDLRVDDLADVYTVWWITVWQATRGVTDDTSRQTNEAVRRQARQALMATPAFTQAGDAVKQEMAESLLLQSMLVEAAVEQAKGKPDQLRAVGQAAAQGARSMGLDLSTMMLTETGFVAG